MNLAGLITIPLVFVALVLCAVAWCVDSERGETLSEYIKRQLL